MNNKELLGCFTGNVISFAGFTLTTTQLNELISIICSVIGIIITIVSFIINIVKWHKKASADGNITEQEIDELKGIVDEMKKNIDEKVEENKENTDDKSQGN